MFSFPCFSVKVRFDVEFIRGTDKFQVIENDNVIVSGRVTTSDQMNRGIYFPDSHETELRIPTYLRTEDVYKEIRLKGYEYGPAFQNILGADRGKKIFNMGNYAQFGGVRRRY